MIDSDYRGEVCVQLRNEGATRLPVAPGDRIAQAMLVPIPRVAGGFGSTGK